MKVTESSTYRLMQTNLDRITNDLLTLRTQGATGYKLNRPSDDPGAIRPVVTTRTQLQQTDRYLETMGQAGDKMAATDGHLNQVENVLVRVKEIAINAVNGSLSQSDLNTLGDEIAELKKELLDTANATVDGKYIFAGYQQNTKPFVENAAYDPDLYDPTDITTWPVLYNGDHNSTQLEITPGEVLEANLTGNEVFLGITNEIAAIGYTTPYQGESVSTTSLGPGTPGNDITITPVGGAPVTISGATDLTDPPGENNYAGKLAGLFNQPGTELIATASEATVDLGPLNLTGFNEGAGDTYTLNITSGGTTLSATLDGPANNYDYSLQGLSYALANTVPTPTNLSATGGTLANGVNYDISSGSLVLTGPADGSDIDLSEAIVGGGASGGIGGSQTVYGQLDIATSTPNNVDLAGAGLTDIGLAPNTLDGHSGRVDLFTILTRTEEAIRAGNISNIAGPGGSVQAQIDNLEIGANQNRTSRSELGARAQRVDTAITHQEDAQVDLKQILSRYQDADMIEVYNDIIQKETAFQAALNVTSRISQMSILDFF